MESVALPLPEVNDQQLWQLICRGEEIGLRLEMTHVGITWETMPGLRHQELLASIFSSIQPHVSADDGCECYRAIDVPIRFPDGTAKIPDISVFCSRPEEDEGFVRMVPETVIEITSPGYEDKDLVTGPAIYLANGVQDVVVLDRRVSVVHHWTSEGHVTAPSPVTLKLACGCLVLV